jgi:drug/metabolite transporter (DMT)-like permease
MIVTDNIKIRRYYSKQSYKYYNIQRNGCVMLNSLKKNSRGIALMLLSSLFVCTGQLFWKLSAGSGIMLLIIGFAFYGIGAFVMLAAYKYGSLSVLQPVLSLNYIIAAILAVTVLHESMSPLKIMGIIVIIAGVFLIGSGDT